MAQEKCKDMLHLTWIIKYIMSYNVYIYSMCVYNVFVCVYIYYVYWWGESLNHFSIHSQDLYNSMSINHGHNLLIKHSSLSQPRSHTVLLMWIERGACSHKTESDFHTRLSHEITSVPPHCVPFISSKVRAVTQLLIQTLITINRHQSRSVLLRYDECCNNTKHNIYA